MRKIFLTLFVIIFAISVFAAGILKPSGIILETKPVTDVAYTLELSIRSGRLITMNNAAANVLTIPANATTAIPVDSRFFVQQIGGGTTSVTAAAGVTINGVVAGTIALPNKYAILVLTKIATDEWLLQIQDPYSFSAPLSNASGIVSISQAAAAADGYLSSTDWNTFNDKQPALGFTPVPDTRTINTYALTGDVTLDADDIADGITNAIITLTQETNFGTAYTHSQTTSGNPHSVTATDISLGNVDNTSDADKPVSTAQQTALDLKANVIININAQTGTAYTLILSDKGKLITMDNGSANTVTIPANASVAFDVGTVIDITQLGAGITTVLGDTGVTLNGVSAGNKAITVQYGNAKIIKIATDTWVIRGNI